MKHFTFEMSYHKTIMANTVDEALSVLNDKISNVGECQRIELIEEKEVKNGVKR